MQRAQGKKISRSNKAQILFLVQYMAAHPGFAAGDFRTPQGARGIAEEWENLASALNELGAARTVDQWKICWRDQKRRARTEGGAHGRATAATGNSEVVPVLSDTTQFVLSAIGTEMAVGIGPQESPIGFNPVSEEVNLPMPEIEVPLVIPEQRSSRPAPQRRVRRILPPDRFLSAQQELNQLIRELITDLSRGNALKEELLTEARRSNAFMEAHLHLMRRP